MIIRPNPIKQYIKIWGIIVPFAVILYFIASFLNMLNYYVYALAFMLIVGIAASLLYRFIYHHHYLKLTDSDIIYYTGIINIKTISVPYHKIDNIRDYRPWVSRILGLVDIFIDTPGEKSVEIVARDMPYSEYQVFYRELKKKMEKSKSHNSGYP